jgi:signal peptidase I
VDNAPRRGAEGSSDQRQAPSLGRRIAGGVREFVIIVVVALVVATLLKTFVAQMFVIPSESMEKTLEVNDRVVAMKMVHYQRGDIIVFEDDLGWLEAAAPASPVQKALEFVGILPAGGNQYLVKRLIGLPGDHVVCCSKAGRVTVNGVELTEDSYLYPNVDGTTVKPSEAAFDIVVPAGRMFVMGDHRNRSADSRYHLCEAYGGVKALMAFPALSSIQGPVRANAYPFDRIRTFSVPSTFANIPAATAAPPATPQINAANC